MPLPIWLPLAMQGLGMLGKNLFNKNVNPGDLFGGVDPSQYKDEMTLDNNELGMLRSQNLRNVQDLNTKNVSEIQKLGAARRLPSGAIMSAIKGAGYETAKGASSIEPQLKQAQINSYGNYLQMLQPYQMAQANARMQNQASDNAFFGQGFGDIFKTVLLWKAGLLGGGGKDNYSSITPGLQIP